MPLFVRSWGFYEGMAEGSEIFSTFATRLDNKPEWLEDLSNAKGAISFVADADNAPVATIFMKLQEAYTPVLDTFPDAPGQVVSRRYRVGTYILPDCNCEGTVESVLLPLGEKHHAELLAHARRFIDGCEPRLKSHFKPFDHLKATVAAAASVLQPGYTNTVTIEKDDWVSAELIAHPILAPFIAFLRDLLEMPNSA